MGRWLRDVSEASSLCPPGRSKARRFAYAALPAARDDVTILCENGGLWSLLILVHFQVPSFAPVCHIEATPLGSKDHENENDDEDDNIAYFCG
jgi:hypothetical protein